MTDLVLRDDADGVCTLTLNRPEKRNALTRELFGELHKHLTWLETGDEAAGVVVIRGAGGHFSAGNDLTQAAAADVIGWVRRQSQLLERFTRLRQIVIAAVEGTCYTGGLEVALAADFILCDETARFADTHGKFGMVGGWGLSQRLPRRVGAAKALEMMTTCRAYTGRQAEAMGLANLCVTPGELDAAVADHAREILANSRHSNAGNKRMIYDTDGMPLAEGLNHEVMRNPGFDPTRRRAL